MTLKVFLRTLNQVHKYSTKVKLQDPLQVASLSEMCILVDGKDQPIGQASKEECHRVRNNDLPLHRAFSVFLFNSQNELLLQKRSSHKITFPSHFTNSCCSHPICDIKSEMVEENAQGIKLAAIRRLNYELGIPKSLISPTDLKYITRIIYKSLGNGVWGEHEVDYILFLKKDLPVEPNPNEISQVRYVGLSDFDSFLSRLEDPITPWFQFISHSMLKTWWGNINNLDRFIDHEKIHHF